MVLVDADVLVLLGALAQLLLLLIVLQEVSGRVMEGFVGAVGVQYVRRMKKLLSWCG